MRNVNGKWCARGRDADSRRTNKKRQKSLAGVALVIATRFDAAGAVKTHVSIENSTSKKRQI